MGRLLSKGFFHPRIHQVMLVCHVRNIQSSRPTRRCSHRIWAGIRGGHRTHCFSWLVVVSEFLSPRNNTPSGPRKRETSKQFNYEKEREKERESERARKSVKGLDNSRKKNVHSGKSSLLEGLVEMKICNRYSTKDPWCCPQTLTEPHM